SWLGCDLHAGLSDRRKGSRSSGCSPFPRAAFAETPERARAREPTDRDRGDQRVLDVSYVNDVTLPVLVENLDEQRPGADAPRAPRVASDVYRGRPCDERDRA